MEVISKLDVKTLLSLYEATDGDHWKCNDGWDTKILGNSRGLRKGALSWYGITWRDGQVLRIELENNGLSGILPKKLYRLKGLTMLNVRNNYELHGSVSEAVMELPHLAYVYIDGTDLRGTLLHHTGHTLQVTQYHEKGATVRYLLSSNGARVQADMSEEEMFYCHMRLKKLRIPERELKVVTRTAFNATGPERVAAAVYLQRIYRGKLARRALRKLLMTVYREEVDEETGDFYYVNNRTGVVTWEKPMILRSNDPINNEAEQDPEKVKWHEMQDEYGNVVRFNFKEDMDYYGLKLIIPFVVLLEQ